MTASRKTESSVARFERPASGVNANGSPPLVTHCEPKEELEASRISQGSTSSIPFLTSKAMKQRSSAEPPLLPTQASPSSPATPSISEPIARLVLNPLRRLATQTQRPVQIAMPSSGFTSESWSSSVSEKAAGRKSSIWCLDYRRPSYLLESPSRVQ